MIEMFGTKRVRARSKPSGALFVNVKYRKCRLRNVQCIALSILYCLFVVL